MRMTKVPKMANRKPFNIRKFKTNATKSFIVIWFVCLVYWITHNHRHSIQQNPEAIDDNAFDLILLNLYKKSKHLADVDIAASNYHKLVDSVPLFPLLQDKNFKERCNAYFTKLYENDENWKIEPHKSFGFNRNHFQEFDKFKEWKYNDWKKQEKKKKEEEEKKRKEEEEKKNAESTPSGTVKRSDDENLNENENEPSDEYYHEEFEKAWDKIRGDEQLMHDYFSHLRIFNKCYLSMEKDQIVNTTSFVQEQQLMLKYLKYKKSNFQKSPQTTFELPAPKDKKTQCNDLESRLYPWLSFEYPEFEHYDGKKFVFPQYKDSIFKKSSLSDTTIIPYLEDNCFLNNYRKKLNGKGIVLSIADKHVDQTIRLIRTLRAHGNTLPIQVVYFDHLSEELRSKLVQASRSDYGSFPKQDLWFVFVKKSIKKEYLGKFEGFGNKILATFFNSFQEIILIDADTIMLKEPEFFFSLDKFVNTGTMFYKDRSTFEFRPKNDLVFFKKLLPSLMDTIVFNIPQITSYTLENEFFKGLNHYMESGLVVMDRTRHFSQPLIMAMLNFYLPIQSRVYGDKELFWLSLVISGDENYAFNKHFAAAIGEVTPDLERIADVKKAQTFKSKEICSNHPGHINDADNHTLLWFNSGFKHCGQNHRVNFEEEFKRKRRYSRAKTLEEFKLIFSSALELSHAVIPPFDMNHLRAHNEEHEPETSWLNMRDYCSGYTWCGYSLMGGEYLNENGYKVDTQIEGIIIEFTEEEQKQFRSLGEIWTSKYDYDVVVQDYHNDNQNDSPSSESHNGNSEGVTIN